MRAPLLRVARRDSCRLRSYPLATLGAQLEAECETLKASRRELGHEAGDGAAADVAVLLSL